MTTQLGKLEYGTEFKWNGKTWRSTCLVWENPTAERDAPPHIIGKPSIKCEPRLGGRFQSQLAKYIPKETEVDISEF